MMSCDRHVKTVWLGMLGPGDTESAWKYPNMIAFRSGSKNAFLPQNAWGMSRSLVRLELFLKLIGLPSARLALSTTFMATA